MKETKYYLIETPYGLDQEERNELREKYRPYYIMLFRPEHKETIVREISEEEFKKELE